MERDNDVVPQWYLYEALSQPVMCERGGNSWLHERGCGNWLSGRCCERVDFVTVSVEIQSEKCLQSGCESCEEHVLHRTSEEDAWAACCVLHVIPGQCSCPLLSAPLLMRAWHSLHITTKAQTKAHSTLDTFVACFSFSFFDSF